MKESELLQAAKIPVIEHEFEEEKLLNVQAFLVKHLAISENFVHSTIKSIEVFLTNVFFLIAGKDDI